MARADRKAAKASTVCALAMYAALNTNRLGLATSACADMLGEGK